MWGTTAATGGGYGENLSDVVRPMDLPGVQAYLRPTDLRELGQWQPDWVWLAGGTWLFSEPQPHLRTLVDLEGLGWPELEVTSAGLTIGATCTLSRLLACDCPESWTGIEALRCAVRELASFKIQHVATVGGNLCLALPAGTLAPAMVVLEAQYDILPLNNSPYTVSALDFQTGARQTLLQPGDVLRHIRIPAASLSWQVGYRRLCMASAGIALSIVVAAYDPTTGRVRVGLGAAVDYPRLLEFPSVPTPDELAVAFETQVPASDWIEDGVASSEYRRHVTQVLVARSLQDALSGR